MVLEGGSVDLRRRRHDRHHRAVPAGPEPQPDALAGRDRGAARRAPGRRARRLARSGSGRGSRHRRPRRPDRGLHPRAAGRWCRPSRRATRTHADCAENRAAAATRPGSRRSSCRTFPTERSPASAVVGRLPEPLRLQRRGDRARPPATSSTTRRWRSSPTLSPDARWCRCPGRPSPTAAAGRTASPSRCPRSSVVMRTQELGSTAHE